jgi:NAD(P)-dependent dehydrogenase (short-subunit alcohol dehydrogenase family)
MPAQSVANRKSPVQHRAVLVTGASSGIGRACAVDLDARGFHVFAGVRTEHDADSLRAHSSGRLKPLMLDITCDEDVARALAAIQEECASTGLAGLINNAGICVAAPMELVPIETLRRQLEVNVIGHVAVTQAFLPLLKRGKGRIINIGSTSGRVAGKWVGPYCASKAALDSITTALRAELLHTGVQVCLIEPGVIATPFWEKMLAAEGELAKQLPAARFRPYAAALAHRRRKLTRISARGNSTEAVCRAIRHALTASRPKWRYVVGFDAKLRIAAATLLPEQMWGWLGRARAHRL